VRPPDRAGQGQVGEVDGGGQRVREERPERGAHQLRHVPREEAGEQMALHFIFCTYSGLKWFGAGKLSHVDSVLV